MAFDASPSFSKGIGIAIFTTIADFRASTNGVPRCVSPLYFTIIAHKILFGLSFLPPIQRFHIDAGDFAAVHGFDVSEVGVDGMEGVFHFAGFRVFPANQFFERHAAFIMVLNNGSGFGDGGDSVFFMMTTEPSGMEGSIE